MSGPEFNPADDQYALDQAYDEVRKLQGDIERILLEKNEVLIHLFETQKADTQRMIRARKVIEALRYLLRTADNLEDYDSGSTVTVSAELVERSQGLLKEWDSGESEMKALIDKFLGGGGG